MTEICVSLGSGDYKACRVLLRKYNFAEIRLDRIPLTPHQVRRIFALEKALIATCRPGDRMKNSERSSILAEAIRSGASFIDIESEAPAGFRTDLVRTARRHKCRVIISYHDFRRTPSLPFLKRKVARCFDCGADIAKIACRVNSPVDILNLLSLYDNFVNKKRLLVIGMGGLGIVTRLAAPLLGAPFAFACPANGAATAPGQLPFRQMAKLLALVKEKGQ